MNKNSFSLFELILVILISSIVVIYSLTFFKKLYSSNNTLQKKEIVKIDLLSTKIFLQKHKNSLDKLSYKDKTLFYDGAILLEKIKDFKIVKNTQKISIKINFDDKVIQSWEFLP